MLMFLIIVIMMVLSFSIVSNEQTGNESIPWGDKLIQPILCEWSISFVMF